jgi:hypothetical protein
LLDVRKELARQKYVNQVLWRKLDALEAIHGSNTRAELALELSMYRDELEASKVKQSRVNDTRSAMLNASSRSSSGVCLCCVVWFVLVVVTHSNSLTSSHSRPHYVFDCAIANPPPLFFFSTPSYACVCVCV